MRHGWTAVYIDSVLECLQTSGSLLNIADVLKYMGKETLHLHGLVKY